MAETTYIVESSLKMTYKDLFCEKDFLKMTIAKIISRFGDSIDTVAYGWLVFQITGSTALLAALYAVSGIPSFIFNMVSGVAVTYMQKKVVVYLSDFGRGAIVCITALLFITGNLEVWHLFLFAFLNSTFEAFRDPAAMPLIMQVIPKEKLEYAVATMSSGSTAAELIGYSVAGVLIGTIGVGPVIFIDALTFVISGLLIKFISVEKEQLTHVKLTVKNYFKDLGEGFKYVCNAQVILSICLFAGIFNVFVIPFNALQPAYVDEILQKGPEAISIMSVAFLIAMLIGGIISPKVKEKISGKAMFIISGLILAIGYFCLAQLGKVYDSPFLYAYLSGSCAMMGLAVPMLNLPIKIAIMKQVEEVYLPRTIAFVNALSLSTTPLGGGLVGLMILYIPLQYVYIIFSVAIIILFILQIFNKSLSRI